MSGWRRVWRVSRADGVSCGSRNPKSIPETGGPWLVQGHAANLKECTASSTVGRRHGWSRYLIGGRRTNNAPTLHVWRWRCIVTLPELSEGKRIGYPKLFEEAFVESSEVNTSPCRTPRSVVRRKSSSR